VGQGERTGGAKAKKLMGQDKDSFIRKEEEKTEQNQ